MLIPKTEVKTSHIAGVGLFAAQDIKKGQIVWQYTPETCQIFTESQFQSLLKSFHKTERQLIQYYLTYCYYQESFNGLVFCLDNSRYVNHSDEPNLGGPTHMTNELRGKCSVALEDIEKGTELTENYRTYDSVGWLEEVCKFYQVFHYENEAQNVQVANCG